jgi:glycosyltransferase involved in cell wall biosynthesis
MKKKVFVSVIITTKNEEKNIFNCINSIKEQDYPFIEIIVVDNYSTDKTKEIAQKLKVIFYSKGHERSQQRNFGIKKANGKYCMYIDADMILSKEVISECVRKCEENKKIAGLYIPEIVSGKGFWINVRRFERSFYNGTVVDCVRFIPKKQFIKVKGFDENLTGPEDWDFDKKIRNSGNVDIIKSPIYHNEGSFEKKKYITKKGYYAKNFDRYISKWGKNDEDIKKQFGFYYRFFGVFTENGKWKKLLMHPVLTLGMYYLRILVGIKFVLRKKE